MIPAIVSDVLVICLDSLSTDLIKLDKLLAFDEDLYVTTFSPNPKKWIWFNNTIKTATQHKKGTLASADTTVQFPDFKSRLLLPMRFNISVGVSSGPLANGVCLQRR